MKKFQGLGRDAPRRLVELLEPPPAWERWGRMSEFLGQPPDYNKAKVGPSFNPVCALKPLVVNSRP